MPRNEPMAGAGELLTHAGAALSGPAISPEVMQFLANVNSIINAGIGLAISVVLLFFCAHVVRWMICGSESEWGRASARDATRAFFAIFIMADVWFILRLLQRIEDFSAATAYAIVIVSFLVLTCWALLGIGDMLLRALSAGVNSLVDRVIAALRNGASESGAIRFLQTRSDVALRFFALILLVAPIAMYGAYWSFTPLEKLPPEMPENRTSETYAMPLVREPGDARVAGTSYANSRYGVSIEYPDGWRVSAAASSDGLASAWNPDLGMYSQLNAGTFADLATSSREAYLTALWRVERNIHGNYARDSEGILRSETRETADIGGTGGTLLAFHSYWRMPDQSVQLRLDEYYVFGKGPVYFTLQFGAPPNEDLESSLAEAEAIEKILDSIRITEPLSVE